MSDLDERVEDATGTAAEGLDRLEGALESLDVDDEERLEELIERLDRLETVARELEELVAEIDLSELPEAVDEEALLDAIEVGEVPDAIAEGEADEAVDLRRVIRAIDLRELLDVGNLVRIADEGGDVTDALDDLLGGEEGGGEEAEEGGLLGSVAEEGEELLEAGKEAASDELGAGGLSPAGGEGFGLDANDTEGYEIAIQQSALAGIEEFREALIRTHGTFQEVYEFNRERLRREDTRTNSRNPTAVSTTPVERADLRGAGRFSTVPRQVKYSTAPGFDRIYGDRFERELEKRRGDTE